jgi:hypothetical protein
MFPNADTGRWSLLNYPGRIYSQVQHARSLWKHGAENPLECLLGVSVLSGGFMIFA